MLYGYSCKHLLIITFFVATSSYAAENNNDNNDNLIDQPVTTSTPPVITSQRSVRRRSHRHQNICRREFLRPLEKRIFDVDIVFKGVVEKVFKRTGLNDLIEGDDEQQQRKRHLHPMMLQQQLQQSSPERIRERLYSHDRSRPRSDQNRHHRHLPLHPSLVESGLTSSMYRAVVRVKRIIRGDKHLQGSRVIVEGLGSRKVCESDVTEKDVRIFLVNRGQFNRLKLNSSLIRASPDNMRKVVVAAKSRICRTQQLDEGGKARCKRLLHSFDQPPKTSVTKRDVTTTPISLSLEDGEWFERTSAVGNTANLEASNLLRPIVGNFTSPSFKRGKKRKATSTPVHILGVVAASIATLIIVVTIVIVLLIGRRISGKVANSGTSNKQTSQDRQDKKAQPQNPEGESMLSDSPIEAPHVTRHYWSESDLS